MLLSVICTFSLIRVLYPWALALPYELIFEGTWLSTDENKNIGQKMNGLQKKHKEHRKVNKEIACGHLWNCVYNSTIPFRLSAFKNSPVKWMV